MLFFNYKFNNHLTAVIYTDIYTFLQNKKHICLLETKNPIDPIDMIVEYDAIAYIEIECDKIYTYIVAVKQKQTNMIDSIELSENIQNLVEYCNNTKIQQNYAKITMFWSNPAIFTETEKYFSMYKHPKINYKVQVFRKDLPMRDS
jgi:hypothetical protein